MKKLAVGPSHGDAFGVIDVLCEHLEPYKADHCPEPGYVALLPTCGHGCSDLTVVGVERPVGSRDRDGGGGAP